MNSPFRQQWRLLCMLQGFCEGRNRGCWEAAFRIFCLTESAHFVICSTDSCRRWTLSLCVCVRTACSDSRHGFFHTLQGWTYHLVTSSLALEDSGPQGYLSSRLIMYYLFWVQRHRHSCTPRMEWGVIYAQQGTVEAKAAGALDAQKSFSGYRDSGKQPALKDFLFLEGADSSSWGCCLPSTFYS